MKLTPAEAETLRRAADVADAQMELVEAMKRRSGRALRRTGLPSILMIGMALLALSTISTVSLTLLP
ncbi:MAG: hypothetical protein ACREDW_11045 [Aestuariivirgaceae bacterium]